VLARVVTGGIWAAWSLLVIFGTPVVALVYAATAPFDRGRYQAGRMFRRLAVMAVRFVPQWDFRTDGLRVRDPRRPYVFVANHESYADIFLISHLPWEMKWMSKDTIFRIPFMGWMMRMAGDIYLRRGDRSSVLDAIAAARDRLDKRVSVMIFPEGTRSRGAELLPFKDGAFRLAVEAQVPVVPIAVAGTRRCMAKGSFIIQRARAVARVLEPIDTAGLTLADVASLKRRVRDVIDQARRDLQRELGLAPEPEAESVPPDPVAAP
jgi:1-acyl-sn-glycerol-3-phosphate acyltransferase